jgi:hypothetical protein
MSAQFDATSLSVSLLIAAAASQEFLGHVQDHIGKPTESSIEHRPAPTLSARATSGSQQAGPVFLRRAPRGDRTRLCRLEAGRIAVYAFGAYFPHRRKRSLGNKSENRSTDPLTHSQGASGAVSSGVFLTGHFLQSPEPISSTPNIDPFMKRTSCGAGDSSRRAFCLAPDSHQIGPTAIICVRRGLLESVQTGWLGCNQLHVLATSRFCNSDVAGRFSATQTFSGNTIKPPLSAAVTGTGKSSVFRHAVPCIRLPYVLAESGLGPRERIKRPEIGDRNRMFSERVSTRDSLRSPGHSVATLVAAEPLRAQMALVPSAQLAGSLESVGLRLSEDLSPWSSLREQLSESTL